MNQITPNQVALTKPTKDFLASEQLMLIGQNWQAATGSDEIAVVNPANGSRISKIPNANTQDVDEAVKAARSALEDGPWSKISPAERMRLMHQIADAMESHAEELAQLDTLDNGKPIMFARGDIAAAVGAMRYFAGWADKIHGTTHSPSIDGNFHAYTAKEPIGVVAMIVPWNYPVIMATMKLAPALAAGCTCVLKPAEDTSLSALYLGKIMLEAGLPTGVVNIVTGYGHTAGDALINHPGIDKIAFTGSTATGRLVARAAADGLKKVSLELGGKSPNIIMPDADLGKAIMGSAAAIFYNSGQTCVAPSRLYVHEDVAEDVIAGIEEYGKDLVIAPGLDEASTLGPLVSQTHFERVTGYIAEGLSEGADIRSGGNRHGEQGFFLEPTILVDTHNAMKVVREEIFGPVLVTQTFRTAQEAVSLANDSDFGLAGCVWTRDLTTAHTMARQIKSGLVGINSAMSADWDVPWGGHKLSGIGVENGREGLEQYLQTKTVFAAL